tara:strand:- start:2112 stop:4313 length:2202 start_codon:yes stop_codon:yes gene_type:complete
VAENSSEFSECDYAFTKRFSHDLSGMSDPERFEKAKDQFINATERAVDSTYPPGLNFEKLDGTDDRWSIRADESRRIILWRPDAKIWIFERAGEHDAMYRYAQEIKISFNPRASTLTWIDVGAVETAATTDSAEELVGHLYAHWTDEELRTIGEFDPDQIIDLHRCIDEADVLLLHPSLNDDTEWTSEDADRALEVLGRDPDDYYQLAVSENPLRAFLNDRRASEEISPLFTAEEMRQIGWTHNPIEDWMIFLHQDQKEKVELRSTGPVMVYGSAGTGKSVVGYHRVLELERRFSQEEDGQLPILFTTFNRHLSNVQEQLIRNLARQQNHDVVPPRVEIKNIDRVAHALCKKAKVTPLERVGEPKDRALSAALRGSNLLERFTHQYLEDEILRVIKGRGIKDFETYADLDRMGRLVRFSRSVREEMWSVYEKYEKELGTERDFERNVLDALEFAEQQPPQYRACVVDEIQDFSLAKLQLVRALVSEPNGGDVPPDGLMLLGDSGQKIYPGGCRPKDAGIGIQGRGRSYTLTRQYRNSQEILDAAVAVAGEDLIPSPHNDLEMIRRAASTHGAPITGIKPRIVTCSSDEQQDQVLVDLVRQAVDDQIGLGDIAILCTSNKTQKHFARVLREAGIDMQTLGDYDGRARKAIKIGTHLFSKGLEFKVVLLTDISSETFPTPQHNRDSEEYEEYRNLAKTNLFVAMTRAQRRLNVLCVKEPSEFLWGALDYFDSGGR